MEATLTQNHTNTNRIAFRNDVFRRRGLGFTVTRGIQGLPDCIGLIDAVRHFTKFAPEDDPHGEHDFGSLEWKGEKVFWKVDYYDQSLQYFEDPTSPRCRRVLTVMLADEY